MGYIDDGMTNVQDIDEPIKVGNGDKARAAKKGTLHLMAVQKTGYTLDVKLEDYKYSPELGICLFRLTKALHRGWRITNNDVNITLTKGNASLTFDRVMTRRRHESNPV